MTLPIYKYVLREALLVMNGETLSVDQEMWVITKAGKIKAKGKVDQCYHFYIVAEMNPVYTPCYVYRGDLEFMGDLKYSEILVKDCKLIPNNEHFYWSSHNFHYQVLMWQVPDDVTNFWKWYQRRQK